MRLYLKSFVLVVVASLLSLSLLAVSQADARLRRIARPAVATATLRSETKVAIIGDSITNLSEATFKQHLMARGYPEPFVSGINGIRSDERVVEAPALIAPTTPDVLVIELGTNDVGRFVRDNPNATDGQRDELARSVANNVSTLAGNVEPAIPCIVVVNVSANTMSTELNQTAQAQNRALATWVERDDQVHLADWDRLVSDELERGEPDGSMTTDMVHPTPLGSGKLADLVRSTIESGCSIR